MASPHAARGEVPDHRHRVARWVVLGAFAIWVTGLLLWQTSWVWGLAVSVAGGAALMVGLTFVSRSTFSAATVWGITVPMSVSLVLISQGVGQPDFGVRVVLVGIGALGIILVFLHVLDERTRSEQKLAHKALSEQRRQLAADVHDVVGHTLSASMLHTTAARLAVRSDPDAAIASLERAEQHGRRSLDDIRSVVRLLRADEPSTRTPTPGTDDIPALMEEFRSAGAAISYSAPDTLDDMPAAAALTVYRVVQEGLTNAIRHGAGQVEVTLKRDHDAVHVEIENDRVVLAQPTPTGSGLPGMRDRVHAVGGTLDAHASHAGSRWHLRASIPT